MEKEFIPYEQALALKELGFDEPCFGFYYTLNGRDWKFVEKTEYHRLDDEMNIGGKFTISAPLWQQAFDWFREKYVLSSWIYNSDVKKYWFTILQNGRIVKSHKELLTYEEAELECLKKLIEIVKQK
jgi:hypothetical protein